MQGGRGGRGEGKEKGRRGDKHIFTGIKKSLFYRGSGSTGTLSGRLQAGESARGHAAGQLIPQHNDIRRCSTTCLLSST